MESFFVKVTGLLELRFFWEGTPSQFFSENLTEVFGAAFLQNIFFPICFHFLDRFNKLSQDILKPVYEIEYDGIFMERL